MNKQTEMMIERYRRGRNGLFWDEDVVEMKEPFGAERRDVPAHDFACGFMLLIYKSNLREVIAKTYDTWMIAKT